MKKIIAGFLAAVAVLGGVLALLFGFFAFWTTLVMFAVAGLGFPTGFWACYSTGILVGVVSVMPKLEKPKPDPELPPHFEMKS